MSGSNVRRLLLTISLGAATLASCFAEPNGAAGGGGKPSSGGSGGSAVEASAGMTSDAGAGGQCIARQADPDAECRPVLSEEKLYAKVVKDEPQDTVVFVDDLFTQFKANCGACHVDTNLGDTPFQANAQNFFQNVGQKAIDAIKSDVEFCEPGQEGCLNFMPPRNSNGKPWSERENDPNDPLRIFVDELESWLAAKKPDDPYPPADVFVLPASKGGKSPYPFSEEDAQALTNLGTCIPDAGMVGTESARSCELDAAFADMKRDPTSASLTERIGLPGSLAQTDLFTLDTAELATYGVVAYQPTYPLWTDDAGKLRYVRVPRGESIRYDERTEQFDIPDNTRFYKTFLKQVKTLDGTARYRKIETRVIVARRNGQSLFGTYEWNDEETQATLVTSPLRNGEPFTDVLKTLIIDEPKAAEIKAQKDAGQIRNYTYELDQQHAVRRYAIPGSERCIQCHMGNDSFILGFSPLQVARRACDQQTLDRQGSCEGGTLQPAGEDELSQLERLIAYGVISGLDPSQAPKLEDPQGPAEAPRNVRTPEELVAQGYLLGNCAHCHNPIGYPTVSNPELKDLLNFLPSDTGGIFEFPLERYSPRIKRGVGGDVPLPYITPSLFDIWPAGDEVKQKYTRKVVPGTESKGLSPIYAPWRSLIYRNVDTPFTYTDNFAIYPHMPLNSPGFDCRAPKLLGQWMVSIPAVKKHPELSEELKADSTQGPETDPQPYVEVKPGDPKYEVALQQTKKRLDQYRSGDRFTRYCPDTSDIIDLDVLRGKKIPGSNRPRTTPLDGTDAKSAAGYSLPGEGVPDRPHWVVTDLTEPPGDWTPRRTDWKSILVDQMIPPVGAMPGQSGYAEEVAAREAQVALVSMLQGISVTAELKELGLKKIPFGLWETEKHDCAAKLASAAKLGEFLASSDPDGAGGQPPVAGGPRAAERMRWMGIEDPSNTKSSLPVYETTPGQAVFNMICVNCHGPNADSKGRQATTLQDMTGGTGRVANFRSGLFGPSGSGGENRKRVFGSDDLAARYLPWMALGGTKTQIPQAILDLVNQTPVLGKNRQGAQTVSSANMLQVAQQLCLGVARLGTWGDLVPANLTDRNGWDDLHQNSGLITANGDAELWERLCSVNNPAPVHVYRVSGAIITNGVVDLYRPETYPANTPVGDRFGAVVPQLTSDNAFAWCVATPTDAAAAAWLDQQKTSDDRPLPRCPEAFLDEANRMESHYDNADGWTYPGIERWAMRGAVNAGLAVFIYLDWLVGQDNPIPPRFNECELLP